MSNIPPAARGEYDGFTPLTDRYRETSRKLVKFLDFVQGETNGCTPGVEEGQFTFGPVELTALLRETLVGDFVPEPDTPITRSAVKGLLESDKFFTAIADECPDDVFWRTVVSEPDQHRPYLWSRSFGAVLQYHYGLPKDEGGGSRAVITAEVELGVLLARTRSGGGWGASCYRAPTLYVDGSPYIIEEPIFKSVTVPQATEYAQNLQVLRVEPNDWPSNVET